MSRLKIVWICHFSNSEIREILPLTKKNIYHDFAPWITNLAKEFEKRKDIELHIIAPHGGLKKFTYTFEKRGIYYYFFKPDVPVVHRNWPSFFPLHKWAKFARNRFIVNNFIKKIKPDIVNLHGAENAYYSITALGIKNIPVYVCIQGIYSNPQRFNKHVQPDKYKIKIERAIHKKCKYFGIIPPFFADLINRDNKEPILFWQSYIPITNIYEGNDIINKKYDFVFFARVTPVKGIEKILEALTLIKKKKENVSLNIIGPCSKYYLNYLKTRVEDLGLKNNVIFSGHLPTLEDVHKKALEAKVTVISSKFENLPGTIVESVMLGIPVVATKVGCIPYLNKDGETILLSEYGDVESLASNMLQLLNSPEYAQELTQKCKNFILREFNGDKIVDRYIKQYHAIISHYVFGIKIPTELLYDKKYFYN